MSTLSTINNALYTSVEEIAPCVLLYSNVWADSAEFMQKIETQAATTSVTWGAATVHDRKGPLIAKQYRDVQIIGLSSFDAGPPAAHADPSVWAVYRMYNEVDQSLSPVVQEYCDKYNVVTSTKEGIQLLKYGKDQFFTAHVDDSQKRPRRVSYSYYVNEDYEGGEIVFSNLGVTVKPKAHQLLVFPSSYPYRHEVRPVTSGTRYAIVQWWN